MRQLRIKEPLSTNGRKFKNVNNSGRIDACAPLLFTFSNFKLYPINIDGVFNNHFNNANEYIRKITVLFGQALPLLSNESYNMFRELSKVKSMHIHQLHGKEDILKQIFKKYGYSDEAINNFMEGSEIYQLEIPFENGATRIVFQRIDNLISFLFLDSNHHIYMNKKFVDQNHSLFYEYCPLNQNNSCQRMNYFNTCFAFEYLDENKYNNSFGYTFDPKNANK